MFLLQAQVLHWKCFKKLQHVYGTQLWSVIEPTLDVIVAGIKVNYLTATEGSSYTYVSFIIKNAVCQIMHKVQDAN